MFYLTLKQLEERGLANRDPTIPPNCNKWKEGEGWQKVENGGVPEPRRPDPVPEQEWKLKGLISISPISSLSQHAHSLLDANTITLRGYARISGTVFSDDVSDPGTLPPKDSGFYLLFIVNRKYSFY